jgi:hypothetical protein
VGAISRLARLNPEEIVAARIFPRLHADPSFGKTSDDDPKYNCIAFAAGDVSQKWWPLPRNAPTHTDVYWPVEGAEETVEEFVSAFETLGYEICGDGSLEEGFEKIALFADVAGNPRHAARQLEEGIWTSKLGQFIDISHAVPDSVAGSEYGNVVCFMRRSRSHLAPP